MSTLKIENLIEKLTINGTEELDQKLLCNLQEYCDAERDNQDTFKYLHRLIYHRLKENHAQIRYGSILVVNFLFFKSNLFRELICDNLNSILEQCLGSTIFNSDGSKNSGRTSSKSTKPASILRPKVWAEKLKAKFLECFRSWHENYGKDYQQLQKCYQLLINLKFLPKPGPNLPSSDKTGFKRASFQTCRKFIDLEQEINAVVSKMDSCFESLIPKINLIDNDATTNASANNGQTSLSNEHLNFRPMQGLSFNIILVSKIEIIRDSTNSDLIDNYTKLSKQLNDYNEKFKQFLLQMKKKKELPNNKFKNRIKTIQMKIASILGKGKDIKIIDNNPNEKSSSNINLQNNNNNSNTDDSDDDVEDDDFEEVVEKEDHVLMAKIMQAKKEQLSARLDSTNDNDHQCRARLPSGRLCPRRDAINCPFHGKIIPRDKQGLPLDNELKSQELQMQYEKESNEWKDPKYLKMLSEKVGRNLQMDKKKRKRSSSKSSSTLIDLKSLDSTPKQRLKTKLKKI